jgi:hypothetical protein
MKGASRDFDTETSGVVPAFVVRRSSSPGPLAARPCATESWAREDDAEDGSSGSSKLLRMQQHAGADAECEKEDEGASERRSRPGADRCFSSCISSRLGELRLAPPPWTPSCQISFVKKQRYRTLIGCKHCDRWISLEWWMYMGKLRCNFLEQRYWIRVRSIGGLGWLGQWIG